LYFRKVIGDSSFVIQIIEKTPEFHCIDPTCKNREFHKENSQSLT